MPDKRLGPEEFCDTVSGMSIGGDIDRIHCSVCIQSNKVRDYIYMWCVQ